jgi:adenosine deaminase
MRSAPGSRLIPLRYPIRNSAVFRIAFHAPALHWEAIMRLTSSPIAPLIASLIALVALGPSAAAQKIHPTAAQGEAKAARVFASAQKQGPLALRAFLDQFPKGADLHVHLSGAVYAETFIRDAAEDGVCVDTVALRFAKAPCQGNLVPAANFSGSMTAANQDIYDRLIDSFSMRSFVPTTGFSGHDQFFATFDRYGGLDKRHVGEWVDEIASRAASQNQQYLELMETPAFSHAAQIAHAIGLNPDFAKFRQQLLDNGLLDEVAVDREHISSVNAKRRALEHCDTQQPASACQVEIRYIYQVLRGFAPEQVFAQTLLGFETVQASMDAHDDTWVGINFVQPEDGFVSMRDYSLQMKMLDYLHSVYPKVHITLHAGELAPGLVPPEGLRFHIQQAVELAHAERIGHGVDVMYENDALSLLKEMARKHVMVEINLSSNRGILGVEGVEHPFANYRLAHVPVALSTDDEGVSRIDITNEYVRAASEYHLSYADIKTLARTGMEHNFLPGASLWAQWDVFTKSVSACAGDELGNQKPSSVCKSFLDGSQKAAAQWEQERRFKAFEAKW